MLRIILASLTLTMAGGVASADHDRRDDRPTVRDQRHDQPQRVNRPGRSDRRVVNRRPVYVNHGRFAFGGGVTHTYSHSVIRGRYYNARVRPQVLVENYNPVPGYLWVPGQWGWSGGEWHWANGYYSADPQYSTYYDDGSYDYAVSVRLR
jgi:hypothetical protein